MADPTFKDYYDSAIAWVTSLPEKAGDAYKELSEGSQKVFTDYSKYLKELKPGEKIQSLKEWATALGEKAKDYGDGVLEDGKKAVNEAVDFYEKSETAKQVRDISGKIIDGGRTVMGVITEQGPNAAVVAGQAVVDNGKAIGAGLAAMAVAAVLGGGEMSVLLIALIGLLVFAFASLMGADGDKGFVRGMFGKQPEVSQFPGQQPVLAATVPTTGKIKVIKGKMPAIDVGKNGQLVFAKNADEALTAEKKDIPLDIQDAKGDRWRIIAHKDRDHYVATEISAILRDGRVIPKGAKIDNGIMTIDVTTGEINTNIQAIIDGKVEAKKIAVAYIKPIAKDVERGTGVISTELGTSGDYTVVMQGVALPLGKGGELGNFTTVVLKDADGELVKDKRGNVVTVAIDMDPRRDKDQALQTPINKEDKIMIAGGAADYLTENFAKLVLAEKEKINNPPPAAPAATEPDMKKVLDNSKVDRTEFAAVLAGKGDAEQTKILEGLKEEKDGYVIITPNKGATTPPSTELGPVIYGKKGDGTKLTEVQVALTPDKFVKLVGEFDSSKVDDILNAAKAAPEVDRTKDASLRVDDIVIPLANLHKKQATATPPAI